MPKVTIQLKWVTQAQFAGYFVAQAKGFYKEAGLDVTIKPGGPDVNPQQVLAGGGADVVVDWMPSALATREKGQPVVNIAQPFKKSGMMLTCRAETGIKAPTDFKDKTLGVWFFGNEYPFMAWMSQARLQDRRFGWWRQGHQAGLQRRSADPEAGGLRLHHDLQ
jgi:NitT/TauT family transport system substrate-binding protein